MLTGAPKRVILVTPPSCDGEMKSKNFGRSTREPKKIRAISMLRKWFRLPSNAYRMRLRSSEQS